MSTRNDLLDIGDTARFAFVFTDEDEALETPTALSIVLRHPGYPTTSDTTVTVPDASIVLGKVFPESVREKLARELGIDGITAASLAAGAGCVEYSYVVVAAGTYRAKATATAPSATAEQASVGVRADFG